MTNYRQLKQSCQKHQQDLETIRKRLFFYLFAFLFISIAFGSVIKSFSSNSRILIPLISFVILIVGLVFIQFDMKKRKQIDDKFVDSIVEGLKIENVQGLG